jgi:hypothetical protein
MNNLLAKARVSVCCALFLTSLLPARVRAAADFVIEAEDFDYGGGQHVGESDTMPYYGGAYDGLDAVATVDYANNDGFESDVYRFGENPNVDITNNGDVDRDSWTVTTNYRIGWTDAADWYNYTRNFPDGYYLVYAALSNSSTAEHMLKGTLWQVTAGAGTPNQTLVQLGVFDAPGSGGWGLNNRVPLRDAAGNDLALHLQGPTTLRYAAENGDIDYYIFKALQSPQISQQPADVTAVEGGAATFTVQVSQPDGISYQWVRGTSTTISAATNASYTLSPVSMSDDKAQFHCFISNTAGNTNSASANLTVLPDTNAPTLVRVINVGTTNVWVTFSEPVEAATATNRFSYSLSPGVAVSAAAFGSDTRTIILTTSALTYGTIYTLTVNNVRDRAAIPNTITPNSQLSFTAAPYAPLDIGGPGLGGTITATTNGFTVVGGGTDIGGTADQFQFAYQVRSGNFDVRVRVESLDQINAWTKAGLLARASLTADSAFAGVLTTPSIPGTFFESRPATAATATTTGWLPVNHPHTWLRLQRNANTFTGFGSFDGQTWTPLGTVSVAMPTTVYFGMAVTSHDPARLAAGRFRDLSDVAGGSIGVVALPHEPVGPSSRKTGLAISEIMYKPAPRADGRNLEFIELFNSNPYPEDISNYRISGDIDFTFPPGAILLPGAFLVVAAVPADIQAIYGITNLTGPYTNSLPKSGVVRLRNDTGAVYLEVPYSDQSPWPVAASGTGHSLVLARPSFGEGDPRAWGLSDSVGGSPGGVDGYHPDPLGSVLINEFLAHTDPPLYDYIELYNHSNQALDIGGCILTDHPNTNRFVIPAPTLIPARGFLAFDEITMGFRLSAVGETIFFKAPDGARVLDAVQFEGQENSVSMGRVPDGAPDFYPLQARTPGTNNASIRVRDIVINEIMYKPISGDDNDQYVELYNKGGSAINVGGWRFSAGINFTLPTNTVVASGGYLVVAKDVTNLLAHYTNLNTNNTVGNFAGRLSGNGERLALASPDYVINTNTPGVTTTNVAWIVVDELTYAAGGRWPKWANGGGSSLELIDPRGNHRLAANWADSDESAKAPWTNIETTGVLDQGGGYGGGPIDLVQVGLLGEGECLVDNIECRPGVSGANYVSNPDFEAGLTGWSLQGDHVRSSLETTGYASTRSLHLRASDSMWTGANSAQCLLTDTSLSEGQTATLRLKARWLRGWPEVLMRVHGNWLETVGRMAIPANLGTPGAPNSRALSNAGPAPYDATHSPTLPAANQAVVVTARVHDPDGLQSLQLKFRVDPSTTYTTVSMLDNGTGGDAVAGDGVYSATIPGKAAGAIVAFYILAADNLSTTTRFPALLNDNGPARECVIGFGDTIQPSGFGAYHVWLTQSSINRWNSLPNLSNEPIDGTFVSGSRVIYNMNSHYAGSPYHQQFDSPLGGPCHYNSAMPEDDRFLGTTSFNKIHAPGNGPYDDDTLLREQTSYWMVRQLRLPWNYRRYVAMYVNGNRRGTLMEDTQVPNGDLVAEQFPDDADGSLYKLQPWFEFDAFPQGTYTPYSNNSWCTLNDYTTTGGIKKLARYRWNYLIRKVGESANNYTNVYALVDAANTYGTPSFTTNLNSLADMEEWMRIFAIEHAVGNWDSFGAQNAQNMYGYKPDHGKWTLFVWDYNIVLGNSGSWGPDAGNLFSYNGADAPMGEIYSNPTFRRAYLRAFKEIAAGPMLNANVDPVMDALHSAFVADSLSVNAPTSVKGWIATMRNSLLTTLTSEGANAAFAISSNSGNNFSTNKNYITISGTAPVEVATITVNGIAHPVSWTGVTTWTLTVALNGGANALAVQGYDLRGSPVANATDSITVNYTGTAELPQGHLVINEIMYNPLVPDASFIEIFNTSAVNAFDLSGFRLDGADFSFPGGSIITPNGFLVIASDAQAFAAAYGATIPVAGEFNGKLSNGGETLKLVKPGSTPDQDLVLNQVTYDSAPPWPAAANGFGPSLQLIDPAQDNNRVANWAAVLTNNPAAPQWQYVTVTGSATSSLLYLYLQAAGDVYLDDLKLVAGSVPESGFNYINNGDFESALTGPWNLTANSAASSISTAVKHSGNAALHLVCNAGGTTQTDSVWQNTIALASGSQYTLSYWFLPNPNGGTLTIRLSGSGVRSDQNIAPAQIVTGSQYTPGAPNSVTTALASFPPLWLNEVQPNNLSGIQDNFGDRDPWVELFNSGTNVLDLGGFYLSDNYSNLTRWPFPTGTLVNPGQFRLVWLDNEPAETSGANLHAGFRASPTNGSVVLTRISGNLTSVVDYLNYTPLNNDRSYGAFPDASPAKRRVFFYATPGAANNNAWPAVPVTINEWMASNTRTVFDPADGKYDDWFELHNSGPTPVDLSGYTLTDNFTNKTQFTIPAGYSVPAGGFLLVWADNDTGQNNANSPQLHVNFKISQAGDDLWLFAPNGTNVDGVTFGPQTNDISQGRWPDGNSGQFYFLTTPTPAAANVLGNPTNSPPVLATIGSKSGNEGSLISFTAFATDPDPDQTLLYSLDPGAPSGSAINAGSGVFTWTPTEAQGPGTYNITVRVTDNGSPALSDSETVAVTVNELNSAPILAFIPDQAVNTGALLTFTATATDPDIPANALTFSLDPGAPAGAGITPGTGVFTWTPTAAQGPATYSLTVRVTDNGSPSRSTAESFNVTVNAVSGIQVTSVTVSTDNLLTLTWTSLSGKTYRVEYKDDLAQTNWSALGDTIAVGASASTTNSVSGVRQRFYRVEQVN